MRFGYARVSTSEQTTDGQVARLREAGCEQVFSEKITGTKASRPEWDKLFGLLRDGDELVVCKLDRLGRSLINLVDIVNVLRERGVHLVILDLGIDTRKPEGKLIYSIMAALAEWEREIIAERTREGLVTARAKHGGTLPKRGPSWTDDQARTARALFAARDANGMSAERIAAVVGVSRRTLYRIVGPEPGSE